MDYPGLCFLPGPLTLNHNRVEFYILLEFYVYPATLLHTLYIYHIMLCEPATINCRSQICSIKGWNLSSILVIWCVWQIVYYVEYCILRRYQLPQRRFTDKERQLKYRKNTRYFIYFKEIMLRL